MTASLQTWLEMADDSLYSWHSSCLMSACFQISAETIGVPWYIRSDLARVQIRCSFIEGSRDLSLLAMNGRVCFMDFRTALSCSLPSVCNFTPRYLEVFVQFIPPICVMLSLVRIADLALFNLRFHPGPSFSKASMIF